MISLPESFTIKNETMKNSKLFLYSVLIASVLTMFLCYKLDNTKTPFTNLIIRNTSTAGQVKVFVTLQSPCSVVGLFGIKAADTIGSCSKGFFYARRGRTYESNTKTPLLGAVISFGGDNLPCQVAVQQGFKTGINIFECSVNTAYETFDISCEDGVNSLINTSVSDTVNWTTGFSTYIQNFRSAQNVFPLENNLGIRGVFPYRCTDCKDLGKAVPENCFNLKDTCNTQRICQVARTNHIGASILIQYKGPAK
jgi:hypothetical protein